MRLDEIDLTHQKLLYNIFSRFKNKKIIDIGTGGGGGASVEVLRNLNIKPDGIDTLNFNVSDKIYNRYFVEDLYNFDRYPEYDVAILCDITYVFECDPIEMVVGLFETLTRCCDKVYLFVPFFDKRSTDYTFRSSAASPLKNIIRPMYVENVLTYFPMFKKLLIKLASDADAGYGIYESRAV